jgi:hypothetical protein
MYNFKRTALVKILNAGKGKQKEKPGKAEPVLLREIWTTALH